MAADTLSDPGLAQPSRRPGMGAIVFDGGTAFRVWAPNAERVAVASVGDAEPAFRHPLAPEGNGYWSGEVEAIGAGTRYTFDLVHAGLTLVRDDPYARSTDHSNGPSVVVDPAAFDWGDEAFAMPPWNALVIYELHIGTFGAVDGKLPADLDAAIARLPHIAELGANAVELMPLAEFPGDMSWGYNPCAIFAVETKYGGADALKRFVKAAHALGIAVILDVVYNHLGPNDLEVWQFDGWSQNGKGGIYFYNDDRSWTPWTEAGRPDYGRGEVRQYLRDNALYWIEEFRVDGLRWDMTLYIRTVWGNPSDPGQALGDGWGLMQWINREIDARWPWKLSIAEDLQDDPWLTYGSDVGGAGFDAQWGANFVHPVRRALTTPVDEERSMIAIRDAILGRYGANALTRVIYTESHDEVANGKARVPSEIADADPGGWYARKRATLGAALVLTAPGIPMLFQGQEFLEDEWFRDSRPLDWDKALRFSGILAMHRDLIWLRRDWDDRSRGLTGQGVNVFHVNDVDKVIAFHRWDRGGPGDDVVVVMNFANRSWDSYRIGFPRRGAWHVAFNGDWTGYSPDFGNHLGYDTEAEDETRDGLSWSGNIGIGPYCCLMLTQPR